MKRQKIRHGDRLGQAMRRMTKPDLDRAVAMLDHYEAQFHAARQAGHQPEGIASGANDVVDQMMEKLLAIAPRAADVKCRRGCSHCCFLDVVVTREEAMLLHYAAAEARLTLEPEKLRRHARGDACPFLDQMGACQVYEHRPISCRKYLVVTDPAFCDVKKYPGHEVGNLVSIEAEIVASAALKASKSGSMPAMLLKHWPAEGGGS